MHIPITEKRIEYALVAVLVMGLFFILSDLFKDLSFPDSSYNFLGKDKRVELEPGKSVTQTFEARRDGLDGINIVINHLDTLGLRDSVKFELAEENCEDILATESISAFTPPHFIYYHFRFDRIPDSADHSYCLKVTYHATERKKNRSYLSANEGTPFADTGYFDDGKNRFYEGRSLQMRPSYSHISFRDNFLELEARLSQYKPVFIKGWVLALGFITLLLALWLAILLIVRHDED